MAQDDSAQVGQTDQRVGAATAAANPPGQGGEQQPKRPSAVEQKATIAVFTSLIRQYELPDHERLNAQLIKEIEGWRASDEVGMRSSNKLGWHSSRDLFKRTEPGFLDLCSRVRLVMQSCVQQYVPDFQLQKSKSVFEGWVNINEHGAFNAPHGHAANHFSGVYYVATPKTETDWSGLIEFMNPVGAVEPINEMGRLMLPDKFKHRPAAGQMLVFPGYVKHWVYPNHEEEDRISIAFNMSVRNLGIEAPKTPVNSGMSKVK